MSKNWARASTARLLCMAANGTGTLTCRSHGKPAYRYVPGLGTGFGSALGDDIPSPEATMTFSRKSPTRRDLIAGASSLAVAAAAETAFPAGAFAQGAGPETKAAKLGFIALTDAAALFVAKEKGIFAKYGMPDVEVQKQASWGTTRDNLVLGSEGNGIDGAH